MSRRTLVALVAVASLAGFSVFAFAQDSTGTAPKKAHVRHHRHHHAMKHTPAKKDTTK
jgi:hypothetical protein